MSANGGCVADLCIDGDQQVCGPVMPHLMSLIESLLNQISAVEKALNTNSHIQDFTPDASANIIFRR